MKAPQLINHQSSSTKEPVHVEDTRPFFTRLREQMIDLQTPSPELLMGGKSFHARGVIHDYIVSADGQNVVDLEIPEWLKNKLL